MKFANFVEDWLAGPGRKFGSFSSTSEVRGQDRSRGGPTGRSARPSARPSLPFTREVTTAIFRLPRKTRKSEEFRLRSGESGDGVDARVGWG